MGLPNPKDATVGEHLRCLSLRVEAWHDIVDVHQNALLWDSSRLPSGYRQWTTFDEELWLNSIRLERRARLYIGVFAQWNQPEDDISADDFLALHFVAVPDWWRRWGVPRDFWNKMSPSFA